MAKTDRRVQYTKTALRQSLLTLLQEQPIGKITVSRLCEQADVNRNTFYAHYSRPEDLLHEIEEELFDEIMRSMEHSLTTESIDAFLLEICNAIFIHGELCKLVFSDHGNKTILKRLLFLAHDRCLSLWTSETQRERSELERLFTFASGGSVAVIEDWIKNGLKEAPNEIANALGQLTSQGLGGFLSGS